MMDYEGAVRMVEHEADRLYNGEEMHVSDILKIAGLLVVGKAISDLSLAVDGLAGGTSELPKEVGNIAGAVSEVGSKLAGLPEALEYIGSRLDN